MRFKRAASRVLVASAVILVGLYLLLPPLSRTVAFQRLVETMLSSTADYDVVMSRIAVGYDFSIAARHVSVSAPQAPPFLRARQVEFRLSPRALFAGRVGVVHVDEPHLFVAHLPPSPTGGGRGGFPFAALQIADGFAHYTTAEGDVVIGPLSLSVDSLSAGPELALRGHSEMALAKLAEQLKVPGVAEGTVETTVEVSGTLPELLGSGLLRVRALRWQDHETALSGDLELPFEIRGATLTFGKRGRHTGRCAGSARGLAWLVKEVEVSGTIAKEADALHGAAEIVLAGVEFHDAEHVRAGEKLLVSGRLEITRGSGPPKVRVDLRLPEGEILWDRLYANLKDHRATMRGELQPVPGGVLMRDLVLRTDGIGSVTFSGSLHPGSGKSAVRARLDIRGLDQLYALAVRDALQEAYPWLARTDAGGALSGNAEYRRGPRDWSLTGRIGLADGHASASDPPLDLRGLSIDLPIALGTGTLDANEQRGSLRVATLDLGGVKIPAIVAALSIGPNVVRLANPLPVPVLGGAFLVNELEASQLDGASPQAHLGFAVREIDLEQLSRALGWPLLHGTVGGAVPEVSIANGEMRSEGEIRVQVFGGDVRVRNFRVTQIFSSVPTLALDIDFEDILLGRLTEILEVGRVSGVARGAVRDLAIVNGQPLRFNAWMETVPRSGVPQRISVKAIRQVSMLGGAGGDPLSQSVLSFLDEYRYAKMGFRCSLENDRFLLQGVEQLEGKDYLVVGSFMPPRVNVISRNQVIAFSEMVRRLKRAASEPTGKPERSK